MAPTQSDAEVPPPSSTDSQVSRPALRDARDLARAQLTQAYADDLIDADEIDERLERLENAEDPDTILALVADLGPLPAVVDPTEVAVAVPEAQAPVAGGSGVPARIEPADSGRMIALFSASRRGGKWVPARRNRVYSVFGAAEIDLREAQLPPGEIELAIVTTFGSTEIIVPPGVDVRLECTAVFGSTEHDETSEPVRRGGTVVRVTGLVLFGSVEVIERLPGESGWAARKRRKANLKALRERTRTKALPPGD